MRAIFAFAITLILFLADVRAAEPKWKKYPNERFGFVLTYPGMLVASPLPTNGGGREFHTADGEFSVMAQGHFLMLDDGDSLEKRWKAELKDAGGTVTYKKKAATWYVVSGIGKNGVEFYVKFFVKESNWAEFRITYPHAKNKKYDPWVAQIERTFVPFREGDFDRLK